MQLRRQKSCAQSFLFLSGLMLTFTFSLLFLLLTDHQHTSYRSRLCTVSLSYFLFMFFSSASLRYLFTSLWPTIDPSSPIALFGSHFKFLIFAFIAFSSSNVSRTWFPQLRFSLFPSVCFVHIHFLHFSLCLNEIREGAVLWPAVPSIHPSVHLSSIDRQSQGRAPKLTVCPLFLDTATQSSVRPLKAFLSAFPEL